jgi:hypothetical protein
MLPTTQPCTITHHNVPYTTIDNYSMHPPILVSERLLRIVPTTQGFTQQDPSHKMTKYFLKEHLCVSEINCNESIEVIAYIFFETSKSS